MNEEETKDCADLFCGGGGTSLGLVKSAEQRGVKISLVAINHDKDAIRTHSANFPWATHLETEIQSVNPRKVVPGGHLHIMVGSPECIWYSKARGAIPINDQSRASAFAILDWAHRLSIDNILLENVQEFQDWGPIYPDDYPVVKLRGRPIPEKKGTIFYSFLQNLEAQGYNVGFKVLVAANYGDPTTRERLFIQARKGKPILWPEPTHSKNPYKDMFGETLPWNTARSCIRFDVLGTSIFNRKKPLAPNTMKRILKGLEKFSNLPFAGEPFIVKLYGTSNAGSVDEPMPTITAQGQHLAIAQPYLIEYHSTFKGGGQERVASLDIPLGTVDTGNRRALINPYLITVGGPTGQGRNPHSIDDPVPTILTNDRHGIIQSFVLGQQSGSAPRSVDEPLMTVAGAGAIGFADPFIVEYYGTATAVSVDEPLPTTTTKARFALAVPLTNGIAILDILYRMLLPEELATAMGFPADYQFRGTKTQIIKQIGNAVCVREATALCDMALFN